MSFKRHTWVCAVLRAWGVLTVVATLGCGGSSGSSATTASNAAAAPVNSAQDGSAKERAAHACLVEGHRTDYQLVADYICPDGSRPLAGDARAGARARVGNVGQGEDGHTVDHYRIPCLVPVDFFVDAYHCPEGVQAEIDPDNLTPAQLRNVAQAVRNAASVPFGERELGLRQFFVNWINDTDQFTVTICERVMSMLGQDDYPLRGLVMLQFVASLGAAQVQLQDTMPSGPDLQREIHRAAIGDVMVLYSQMLREADQRAKYPPLDQLLAADAAGQLVTQVDAHVAGCSRPNLQISTDGQATWPPQGPGCEQLVRCCESNGLVANGASTGGAGLVCILAAAGNDCAGGVAALAEHNITCQ